MGPQPRPPLRRPGLLSVISFSTSLSDPGNPGRDDSYNQDDNLLHDRQCNARYVCGLGEPGQRAGLYVDLSLGRHAKGHIQYDCSSGDGWNGVCGSDGAEDGAGCGGVDGGDAGRAGACTDLVDAEDNIMV